MLRHRQQATDHCGCPPGKIVEGAVGMAEMALEQLSRKGIVTLDEEKKAAMVSNLMVVLCGERGAQPILKYGYVVPIIAPDESAEPTGKILCWKRSNSGRPGCGRSSSADR